MKTEVTSSSLASAGGARGEDSAGEAVRAALDGLDGDASFVLCFPSNIDATRAVAAGAEAAGGVPIAGMTGSGAITAGKAIEEGCAAIAFGAGVRAGFGLSEGAGRDLAQAAHHAGAEALAELGTREDVVLLLFLDTRSGDQALAVAGAYEVAGPRIPLVGGGAGSDEPAQMLGAGCHTDSVVAVAISASEPIGVGHAHGCRSRSTPAIATRAEGRYLFELDGRPAAEVYLERLGYAGMDLGKEEFGALAVTHPLAQPELNDTARLRHVLGRGPEGGLECATYIPANAAIDFMEQSPGDIVESAGRAVRNAADELSAGPRAALVFDCAGRKRAVADSLGLEVEALEAGFGSEPPPMAGIFSHGEVFRKRGAKGDRNHAVVVAAFA
jgi:hypothetical protein